MKTAVQYSNDYLQIFVLSSLDKTRQRSGCTTVSVINYLDDRSLFAALEATTSTYGRDSEYPHMLVFSRNHNARSEHTSDMFGRSLKERFTLRYA